MSDEMVKAQQHCLYKESSNGMYPATVRLKVYDSTEIELTNDKGQVLRRKKGTIADIESKWAIAGNKLVSLSEQELIDCDRNSSDSGCPFSSTK